MPEMTPMKTAAAIALCLMLVLSTCGCLDIYGARDIFGKKPAAGKPVYKDRNKCVLAHAFETKITDPGTWSYASSCRTVVKKNTQSLSIFVEVTIVDIPPIPNVTIPERYVRCQVIMADGSTWVDSKYTSTTLENISAQNPIDGPWTIRVESSGLGSSQLGYQDTFKIFVAANEPV